VHECTFDSSRNNVCDVGFMLYLKFQLDLGLVIPLLFSISSVFGCSKYNVRENNMKSKVGSESVYFMLQSHAPWSSSWSNLIPSQVVLYQFNPHGGINYS